MPPLKGDVRVVVTDGTAPLAGVAVATVPGPTLATTDAQGHATLSALDIGAWVVSFHLAGFVDQTVLVAVNLSGPTNVTVSLAVDPTAAGPAISVADQLTAGFGAAVSLTANTSATGLNWSWRQVSGPTVTLTGANTATVGFTTASLATTLGARALANAGFGVLGLSPDQAGNYQFEVTATDARGHATRATATVNSTRPTQGLRMAPVGVPVWLQGDGALITAPAPTTWSWTMDLANAAGSTATLRGATTQFPSFVPDRVGTYVLTETVSGKSLKVYAGTWRGAQTDSTRTGLCQQCHGAITADTFTPYLATKHATALQRQLDGLSGPGFQKPCLSCHALGVDPTASNGGFDDLQATSGWSVPSTLQAGNWTALVATPNLGDLAGVQCESCHGPNVQPTGGPHMSGSQATPDLAARISWSSSPCASCHQSTPRYTTAAQYNLGKHSDRTFAIIEGTAERNSSNVQHCGRCHSAQGFGRYVKQLAAGYAGYLTSDARPLDPTGVSNHRATSTELSAVGLNLAQVEPQTCPACHDPHAGTNPSQVRVYDSVTRLPNGMGVSGMGKGALCVTCHNSRMGEHTDTITQTTDPNGDFLTQPVLLSFSSPHLASQGDVTAGFNAYFMPRFTPSRHLSVRDACVGCHVGAGDHSFVVGAASCATCHGTNVDGVALKAANQAQLDGLRTLWASKTAAVLNSALNYIPLSGSMSVFARAWDPASGLYSTTASVITPSSIGVVTLSAANPVISVTAAYQPSGTLMLALRLTTAVTFQPLDPTGVAVGAPVTSTTLYVSPTALLTNQQVPVQVPYWVPGTYYTPFSAPPPRAGTVTTVYPSPTAAPWVNSANAQVLYKAYWNFSLLLNDGTLGLHNPTFFSETVAATSRALNALP